MKRFLLFSGDDYYPSGGWWDLTGDFDTIEEVHKRLQQKRPDWYQIVDTTIGQVVDENK